jgi:hypothetical protein
MTRTTLAKILLLSTLLALASGLPACGSSTPQVVVTPMTPDDESAFENGVDFIDDPSLLEGSWLDAWEADIEHRVTLADAIAIVRITTVRRDTDLERHDTYHLVASVESVRMGTLSGDLSLAAREGDTGFGTLVGNDDRLLTPPADHPDHFVLYVKWTRDEAGSLVPRWHMSPAGPRIIARVNSLIELRRQSSEERRRVIVRTTVEDDGDDDDDD